MAMAEFVTSRLSDGPRLLSWGFDLTDPVEELRATYGRAAAHAYGAAGDAEAAAVAGRLFEPHLSALLFWPERHDDLFGELGRLQQDWAETPDPDVVVASGNHLLRISSEDPERLAAQGARIEAAVELLRRISPEACAFTLGMTSRVHVADHEREVFWSSTPERHLFGTRLWNLTAATPTEQVADALLHEAIHTWLDLDCLLRERRLRPGGRWMSPVLLHEGCSRFLSPWTGAPLSVVIYVHACFVWYGLLHLWALASPETGADPSEVRALLRRAWAGFLGRPDLQLAAFAAELAPDICETVEAMTAAVLAAGEAELAAS